jgi:cell division protein ZapA|tara:strand:- start:9157 stop:9435 length:279 start_codon:yes stop_codon:yes gene_type:complete
MTDTTAVQVSILTQRYTLTCPAGKEANLRQAAENLDQILQDIKSSGRVMGLERMAVMAALNMSAELIDTQEQLINLETALEHLDKRVNDSLS